MIIRSPRKKARARTTSAAMAAAAATLAMTASLVVSTAAPADASPSPAKAPGSATTTSPLEAKRVDSVPTPKLDWYPCNEFPGAQCATVEVPRDYDEPDGPTIELAVTKTPATDQEHKQGSVFVNPGGPGGSATAMAGSAAGLFDPAVLQKYDVIGVDPRGVGYSEQVKCFPDAQSQQPVLNKLAIGIPTTDKEIKTFGSGARELGTACSDYGADLAGAVSTAETARDMDVIRRAVGDDKLTYLGFSYGSYLGQVYANLFPDRVRSLVIDGVLDPIAWAGTEKTKQQPQTLRLKSGEGADRAMKEILRRCDQAGGQKCPFASEDSVQKFDQLVERIKKEPIQTDDPSVGTITYPVFIGAMLNALYDPTATDAIMRELQLLWEYSGSEQSAEPVPADRLSDRFLASARQPLSQDRQPRAFPYDNSLEAFSAVLCTDSMNPGKVGAWEKAVDRIGPAAQYFGPAWGWQSAQCASKSWTVTDEDAHRGPFNATTSGPVLVVGNYWDPATNYAGAQKAADLLPNSGLLLSDNWGHTAYGTSACATNAVTTAILEAELPAEGTRCVGDVQPFGIGTPTPQQRTEEATGVDPEKVRKIIGGEPGRY